MLLIHVRHELSEMSKLFKDEGDWRDYITSRMGEVPVGIGTPWS